MTNKAIFTELPSQFYLHELGQESLSVWAVMPSNPPFQAQWFPLVLSLTLSGLLWYFLYRTGICVCPKGQRSETPCYNHNSWTLQGVPSQTLSKSNQLQIAYTHYLSCCFRPYCYTKLFSVSPIISLKLVRICLLVGYSHHVSST